VSVCVSVCLCVVDISQNTGISLQHVTSTLNLLRLASNKDTGSVSVCLFVCLSVMMCSADSFLVQLMLSEAHSFIHTFFAGRGPAYSGPQH